MTHYEAFRRQKRKLKSASDRTAFDDQVVASGKILPDGRGASNPFNEEYEKFLAAKYESTKGTDLDAEADKITDEVVSAAEAIKKKTPKKRAKKS